MPVSLSEWRVRIGTYVSRTPVIKSLGDDQESKEDSSKKTMGPTAEADHQTSTDKTPSKPEKDDSSCRENNEQKTQTAADKNVGTPLKESKKRKRHNRKGSSRCGQYSGAFLSFRCFLKSGASPLLRFLLLVFTAILLVRSGDVEVNPGPNEGRSASVSDSTLLDIAKRIPQDKMYDLGNSLGIDFSDVRRHVATNTMGGAVNCNGTINMLVDWRDSTPIQQQGEVLRNALNTSSLPAVAEQYIHPTEDPPSREEAGDGALPTRPHDQIPITNTSSSEQAASYGMRAAEPHPHMGVGAAQMISQTGMLDNAHQTCFRDQTQEPTIVHPLGLSQCKKDTPDASRTNPSQGPYKRTYSGTLIESTRNMDTSSSSREPFTMPSTSGHSSTFAPQNPSAPSTDGINPITETELKKCIADFKCFYRVNLCHIPTSPLDLDSIVELQCIFTNLYLVKENKKKCTKKKIELKYEDLLTIDMNGEPAKRIMIQGEAGVGKTTFCAKIAWDWVTEERYQEYTLVAVVPLREAKNGRTIGQVLKSYLPDDNKVTSEQLDEYIRTNQDKVLTVLDGFDEFGVEMSSGENQIVQILKGEKHTSGRVIVTTRPWKAHKVVSGMSLRKQYAVVRIEGFKPKDVETYVTKFYQDDQTSAQTLLEFMEEGTLISEAMAPFPIFCSMLCHMWKEVERREVIRKLQTFSQLFQEMIIQLEEHFISKQATTFDSNTCIAQDIKKKIDDHLRRISEIAFNGLLINKLAFLEQEFESCVNDRRIACGIGILTRERTMSKRADGAVRKIARVDSTFSFPHKLFQEYTAAVYLHDLFNSNRDNYHRLMQNNILPKATEFKYLLYFTGSFDKGIAKDILTRLIEKKVGLQLIVEVAYEGHSEEAPSVIEEKLPDMHRSLTIKKDTTLHVIASYMFALTQLESLCIERIPQSKILSRNLAEKVCSLQTLKELELHCKIPVSFSENLLQHSKDVLVETFLLRDVVLTKDSCINLAKCICFLPHLKKFQLTLHRSGDDFCRALSPEAPPSKVEFLELGVSNINKSSSQKLLASVFAMLSLKNLKLHVRGNLSDGFYSTLREGASSLKVEFLELGVKDINESSSQNLLASVFAMLSLKNLKLHVRGNLSDGFYSTLREGASSLKVESLDLDVNVISEHGLQSLGTSICSMPCLRSVRVGLQPCYGYKGELKATLLKDVHVDESSSSSEVISSTCQIAIKLNVELLIAFVSSLASSHPSKVKSLELTFIAFERNTVISEPASQNLGASICAMPCLKNVKLSVSLSDGFYIALRKGASSLKVESLELKVSESASHDLCASICNMPCLKNVKLSGKLSDGFYSALREGALSLKVESLDLLVDDISEHGLQSLGTSIWSMPCLRSVRVDSQSISWDRKGELKATLLKDVHVDGSSSLSSEVISSTCQIDIKLKVEQLISFVSSLASSHPSKVESLELTDHKSSSRISEPASQNLGASICAMPCLENVKLSVNLSDGFYIALRKGASSLKVESLELKVSESASQDLCASICAMSCLKNVKLSGNLSDGFYIALREGALSLKVESLDLHVYVGDISEHGLQSLGTSICSMPCLRSVRVDSQSYMYHGYRGELKATLLKDVHVDGSSSSEVISSTCQIDINLRVEQLISFVSSLASSHPSKVESLELISDSVISEPASQNLFTSICAMPCLLNVKLSVYLSDGFYIALRKGASALKVESLELKVSESASHDLCASICSMPCLKNVKLSGKLSDGFYSALREGALSLKVESLELHGIKEAASQYLGASVCAMPYLKNVELSGNLSSDEFFTTLRERASSLKINQMHLMGATLDSSHLSTIGLMSKLISLTLFEVRIKDNGKLYEEDGSDPPNTPSSTSLTELNVDHDSFLSLCGIGLLERFPLVQKLTLAFHRDQTPFPQELLHHVSMPTVIDLSLYRYTDISNEISLHADITSLSLEPFPNLSNLSLINISIRTANCMSILKSLRRKGTLKTISIKDCDTDADLDPLCNEINSEGKITVTVDHGRHKWPKLVDLFKKL